MSPLRFLAPSRSAYVERLRRYAPGWVIRSRRRVVGSVRERRAKGPRLGDYRPESCLEVAQHAVSRAKFPAVDAHSHLGRWLSPLGEWKEPDVPLLIDQMDACNVRTIVNLDGRWGDELGANLDRYDRAHPGRFATFCHPDWDEARRPGFGDRLAVSLERSVASGARGLKVWKDLGLRRKDHDGRLLLPDDGRLAPVWAAAARLGVPVLIHTADPIAFYRPVDVRNERLEELLRHPTLSLHGGGFPAFPRLMESLERLVAANPETTFIGAHVGCYAENLAWVSRMLDAYANFHVDISGRLMELGRQPRAARLLAERHADRVLFGTDIAPFRPGEYAAYFRFLETEDESFPYSEAPAPGQGRWTVSGIGLPDAIVEKVYGGNARRLIPGLAP